MKLPAYNPEPEYVRELLERCDLSQNGAARLLMVSPRTLRYWCAIDAKGIDIPYGAQLALEYIAYLKERNNEN